MSLSAVHPAARQGSQSVTEIVAVATGPGAKCFRRNVLSAAETPKYPSNRAGTSQYTVAIVTAKSDRVGKPG
jgi:hypothetical protein